MAYVLNFLAKIIRQTRNRFRYKLGRDFSVRIFRLGGFSHTNRVHAFFQTTGDVVLFGGRKEGRVQRIHDLFLNLRFVSGFERPGRSSARSGKTLRCFGV